MLAEATLACGYEDAKGEAAPCVARLSDDAAAVCDAVYAEAIPECEAKGMPVAEVEVVGGVYDDGACGDASDDDDAKHCVEVKLEELGVAASPDGVRARAVALRDAVFCDRPLRLRGDASSGGLEDVAAVLLRDRDRGRTLLHHAAERGRARAISDLLSYANSFVPDPVRDRVVGGDAAVRAYCDVRDEGAMAALDVARAFRHDDCARLLRPFTTDDAEAKEEAKAGSKDEAKW